MKNTSNAIDQKIKDTNTYIESKRGDLEKVSFQKKFIFALFSVCQLIVCFILNFQTIHDTTTNAQNQATAEATNLLGKLQLTKPN